MVRIRTSKGARHISPPRYPYCAEYAKNTGHMAALLDQEEEDQQCTLDHLRSNMQLLELMPVAGPANGHGQSAARTITSSFNRDQFL
jgi:hypothetical protein